MGYVNAHKQSSKNMQPQRKAVMPDKKEPECPSFLNLMAGERVLRVVHASWLNHLFSLALGGIFLLSAIALLFQSAFASFSSDASAAASVTLYQAFIPSFWGGLLLAYAALSVFSNVAVVTNYRVVTKKGILSTRVSEVRIVDIRGISQSKGIWQTIIGVSNLGIGTAATGDTEIKIVGIRNADAVVALVNSLRPSA